MERGAEEYFDTIDGMGGMVEAIEQGYPQREIAEASYRFQQAVERREKVIVGVNDFVQADEPPVPILYIDETHGRDAARAARGRCSGRRDNDAVAPVARRAARGGAGHRRIRCTRCSTASAPTRPSARCATRCATCGASTKRCR